MVYPDLRKSFYSRRRRRRNYERATARITFPNKSPTGVRGLMHNGGGVNLYSIWGPLALVLLTLVRGEVVYENHPTNAIAQPCDDIYRDGGDAGRRGYRRMG